METLAKPLGLLGNKGSDFLKLKNTPLRITDEVKTFLKIITLEYKPRKTQKTFLDLVDSIYLVKINFISDFKNI